MYSDCYEGPLKKLTGQDLVRVQELVRPCDIKGILHAHSRWTDGAHSLESMVDIAREIGLEYLGISDHFHSEDHQEGLDLSAARVQRAEVDRLVQKFDDFDILQGVEIDVNKDGSLPVDDDVLDMFDFVIVAFPENGGHVREELFERAIQVAAHPKVTILGDPVGDFMLRGCNGNGEMEKVLSAAASGGTAVEINANPCCSKLDWTCCKVAQELGVYMAISPNAHRAARLVDYRHGAQLAHDAGITCGNILNTLNSAELRLRLSNGLHVPRR